MHAASLQPQNVDLMAATGETTHLFRAGLNYATNPTEVGVAHETRFAGDSNYTLYGLIRYNFDLITGFSVFPLQVFTLIGMAVSFFSFIFVMYLMLRRLIVGPEVEGVFTCLPSCFS